MKRQPRLSRAAVIARLRDHAAKHGAVSAASLGKHDRFALRSLYLYFPDLEAARRAADVPAAKPVASRQRKPRSPKAVWSLRRVIEELQRLDRSGQSTSWADLMQAGHGDLVAAAAAYAGGLQRAREKAGVTRPARRKPAQRWNRATIVLAIEERVRKKQSLASSKVPPRFVAAARFHFGSWANALAAAGVAADDVRLQRRAYTKPEIRELIRQLARDGTPLRASTIARVVKLDTVRKLFGSVEAAIREAGLAHVPKHPSQKWSPERVIEEIQARAKLGKFTFTRALSRAAQLYFGGAHAARVAAGLPALLREPWTKESLIKELQRCARRGDSGSTLWAACKRLFGSMAAARRAAGVPATQRTKGMAAWSKKKLLVEYRRRLLKHQQLSRGLIAGLRRQFGSLARARKLAGVPARRTAREAANLPKLTIAWTPARIRRALREPEFDALDPTLDPAFEAACIHHFGSVTAARTAAARSQRQRTWTKATLIAEVQARLRRGLKGVGRLLRAPAVRLFGSIEAALKAAVQTAPRRSPRQSRAKR